MRLPWHKLVIAVVIAASFTVVLTPSLISAALQPEKTGQLFTREVFFNIQLLSQTVFYVLVAITTVGLLIGIYKNLFLWKRGRNEYRLNGFVRRFVSTLWIIASNRNVFHRHRYAGVLHLLIMWSVIILFIGTSLLTIHHYTPMKFLVGETYLIYDLTLDVAGLLLIVGVILGFHRRYVLKPRNLNTFLDDKIILSGLLTLAVTGLLLEGLRLMIDRPAWEFTWAPIGVLFGTLFQMLPEATLRTLHFWMWWIHALLALSFIAYLPFSKLFHILASTLNIMFRSTYPKGWIPRGLLQEGGVGDIGDLTWRQLMDMDACTVCGRCTDSCPAASAGRILSPMQLIQSLKTYSKAKYGLTSLFRKPTPRRQLLGGNGYITPEELWGCTTCRACMEVCPVAVEHLYTIIDFRRTLVEAGDLQETPMRTLNHMLKSGNAYGQPQTKRLDWAKGLGVKNLSEGGGAEVLLFVGCMASFDPRAQKIAQALCRLLIKAGVDFGVLGKNEFCSGHEARRMGEEGLFEILVEKNTATIMKTGVKRIITISPHCYNAFKNDYEQLRHHVTIEHYTQFLAALITKGILKPKGKLIGKITYHDPCYLGRHNGEYHAPRFLLNSIPGVNIVEMPRCRENSFCCGAGGGGYWIEVEHETRRISELRVDEASSLQCNILAVACPFCLLNLEDAVRTMSLENKLLVKDVAELLDEAST